MEIKRHIGKHLPSNTRVVVTYPVIPNTTEHTLIVHVDRLSETLKDHVMRTVNTQAAQVSVNLADVLGRTLYADSGKSIFQVLHESGSLKKVSIDEVEMHPNPALPIPLRTVLVESGLIPRPSDTDKRFNQTEHNMKADETGNAMVRANNLIAQAKLLEQEATRKREEAYSLAPSLAPQAEPVIVDVAPVDPATLLAEYNAETTEAPETQAE